MNTENVIVMIFTILFTTVSIIMLRYEWMKQEQSKTEDFWKFPKWLWVYGAVMLIIQTSLAGLLPTIYEQNTACMTIKRLGLLALIWQAAAIDWKYQKIPNDIILAGIGFRVMMLIPEFLFEREVLLTNLFSEVVAFLGITFIVIICLLLMKNSIGMGDLKLLMIMALCQGVDGIMSSGFMSMVVSFFVAVFMLLTRKKTRKDALPFAPCILVGTLISVFLTGI